MSEFKLYVYNKNTNTIISGYNGIDISGNSYTITGLTDNTEYTIKMRRYDENGNLSNISRSKNVITDNATIPNVLVTNESFASFRVYFDEITDASGYLVYLSKDGSPVNNYNPYFSNTNDFAITGLIPESTYSFYIQTAYGGKTSQPSNTYNAITEAVNLDNVSNLVISNVNYRNSTITWDSVLDATHYDIYIENVSATGINEYWDQTTLTGNASFPVSVTGSNSYTFDNGIPLQPFRYYVKARYYQYESDYIQSTSGSFSIVPNVVALEESNVGTSGFTANWTKILDIGSILHSGYYIYLYKDSILQNTIVLTNQDNSINNSFMNGSSGFVTLTNGMSSLTGTSEVMYILKPNGSYETNLEILENTTYTYKVKAHHQFIASSGFSNEISVTTDTSSVVTLVEKIFYSEIALNGNYRLVKANPDNTNKVYLTPDTYSSISPRVSHDGKKLAFIKEYSTTKSDIMIYDLETNIISNLTNFATNNNYVYGAKWNSNDTKILFAYFAGDRDSNPASVKQINVITQVATTIYTDSGSQSNISPEYSLNDNEIYLTSTNSNGLIKYNITTSGVTVIAFGNKYFASQHPTQNKILYSAGAGGAYYEILQRDLGSGIDTTVYPASAYNVFPKYSPDGNSVIWVSYETGHDQLKKKNLLTNTTTNLTSDSTTYRYPEWANVLDDTVRTVLDIKVNNSSVYDNSNLTHTVNLIGSPSIISTASGYAINLDSGNKAIRISDNSDFEFSNHHTGLFEFRKDNAGTIRVVSKDSGGEQYRYGILSDGSMFWIFTSNNYPSNPSYLKFNTAIYSWIIGRIYKMAWCLDLDTNTFKILIKDTVTNVITDLSYTIETGVQYYSSIADFTEIRNASYDLYIGNDSSSNQPIGAVYNYKLFDRAIDNTGLNALLS